jgi:hypothetical protein
MAKTLSTKFRRFNLEMHRDFGFFFSALIIIYSISGIALNHINDWNSDFSIKKKTIQVDKGLTRESINDALLLKYSKLVGEDHFKVFDFPTRNQVKVYYDNATLHIHFDEATAEYESVVRRPFFYEVNSIHRNSIEGWKWISDIFALCLIFITFTGMFIIKGKYGISGRGKWLVVAGLLLPVLAVVIYSFS